ncbi:MAG: 16S rRNA (guanine(527)-N(7))-methyltransferase RsmG [Robiginitomaculum sp.]|nr:16S rRNA (guanine(527)-N(7))-methyltransferase RsmG [Robiginitomaculum sp.]
MTEDKAIKCLLDIVSRETFQKFEIIQQQLILWSKRFNLVAPSSLPQFWARHVLDSVQLYDLAPKSAKSWLDLGSGAGFPGIILAIMIMQRPGAKMTLIEANGKKANFLKHCAREVGAPAQVLQQRIEVVAPFTAEVITARALSSLSGLLEYSLPFSDKNTLLVLPKGKQVEAELSVAQNSWKLEHSNHSSITDNEASILCIRGFSRV